MPVRVTDVKIPFPPRRILRSGIRREPGIHERLVLNIGAGHAKNHPTPPVGGIIILENEVDESLPGAEACEVGLRTAIKKLKAALLVEVERTGHVGDGESNGANVLDGHVIA